VKLLLNNRKLALRGRKLGLATAGCVAAWCDDSCSRVFWLIPTCLDFGCGEPGTRTRRVCGDLPTNTGRTLSEFYDSVPGFLFPAFVVYQNECYQVMRESQRPPACADVPFLKNVVLIEISDPVNQCPSCGCCDKRVGGTAECFPVDDFCEECGGTYEYEVSETWQIVQTLTPAEIARQIRVDPTNCPPPSRVSYIRYGSESHSGRWECRSPNAPSEWVLFSGQVRDTQQYWQYRIGAPTSDCSYRQDSTSAPAGTPVRCGEYLNGTASAPYGNLGIRGPFGPGSLCSQTYQYQIGSGPDWVEGEQFVSRDSGFTRSIDETQHLYAADGDVVYEWASVRIMWSITMTIRPIVPCGINLGCDSGGASYPSNQTIRKPVTRLSTVLTEGKMAGAGRSTADMLRGLA